MFGPKFSGELVEEGVMASNIEYGGLEVSVSNVVFVHGSIDPWHAMGVLESRSESTPAILISGAAHCANMYPDSEEDCQELREARHKIGALIHQWIEEKK